MAQKPLSYAEARSAAKFYNKHLGNTSHAAKGAGINRDTFYNRCRVGKERWPKLFGSFPVAKGGNPSTPAPKPERTVDDHVRIHRADTDASHSRARLKDATKLIVELEDRVRGLEWAGNVSTKPADWTLDMRTPKGKSPHIPLLFFSDAQVGEIVRADETDTPWEYNSDIFRERYRRMISTTIDLATNHGGSRWSYPGVIYARGGDNISGGLHEDLRELGEDGVQTQQAETVFEEEARGIQIMLEVFGKVEVETVTGNHDRTTHKPPTKLAWARSYDRLIHKMLATEFKREPRVTFHTGHSPDIRFPIFERRLLMTHGDKIGSRGGAGFVGPGATILRGWQKMLMEQAALGYRMDMILTGHFHYPMSLPIGIANGSFTGTTEFGKSLRFAPQPPMQYLSFFHSRHGCVDVRPIHLAGAL